MPVAFSSGHPRVLNDDDKSTKKACANKHRTAAGAGRTNLRTTSESSSFAQNGSIRPKNKKVLIVESVPDVVDSSIEPRKEAARRHRAKLGNRSYSDSHALHEEVLKLYDTEIEVFVTQDETKPRGILKQTSTTSTDYYSMELNDSHELSACLEMLYSETTVIESDDSLSSSASSSLCNKNSSSDDVLGCDIDGAELKRVRFAAKPQLQLYRQNASIAGRSHKNQKKKLAKKKKKNTDSVSDHDDDSNQGTGTDTSGAQLPSDRRRKRNSSGGSDSGVNTECSSSLSSVNDAALTPDDDDLDDDAVMHSDEHATPTSNKNDVDFVHRALNLLGLGSSTPRTLPHGNTKIVSNANTLGNAAIAAERNEKIAVNVTNTVNGVSSHKRRRRRTRSSCQ